MKLVILFIAAIAILLLILLAYNALPVKKVSTSSYDRIVFVPGIKTDPKYEIFWKQYLKQHVPKVEHVFIEKFYHYTNDQDILDIKEELVSILSDRKSTLVLTHSYGGIVAVASLQSEASDAFNVVRVISTAPPYDPGFTDLTKSLETIGFSFNPLDIDHVGICGWIDTTVPCRSTRFLGVQTDSVFASHVLFMIPQLFGGRTVRSYF